jgi:chromate reductase
LSQYHFRQAAVYPGLQILPTPGVFAHTYGGDFANGNLVNDAVKGNIEKSLQALYDFTLRLNKPLSIQRAKDHGVIPDVVFPEVSQKTPQWEDGKVRVLAVSGSLRSSSFNTALLREAIASAADNVEIQLADPLNFPLFNEDIEKQGVPTSVQNFVEHVKSADAILFATPEYNYSYTPVLKNAIDWASRQKAFNDKPVALIGAGAVGATNSQSHLRQVSVFLGAHVLSQAPLNAAAFAPGNFDFGTGSVLSEAIKKNVKESVDALVRFTNKLKASPEARSIRVLAIQGAVSDDALAGGIVEAAKKNLPSEVEFTTTDISNLPRYDTSENSGSDLPQSVASFVGQVQGADAILFVTPEYNNSISPILKNALDWGIASKAFEGKAASSIGYGKNFSGTLALYHLRQVAVSGAINFLNGPSVQINLNDPKFSQQSGADLVDDTTAERIVKHLEGLRDWARRTQ